MPAYGTTNPVAVYPGDSAVVLSNENPNSGVASLAVAVGRVYDSAVDSLSVEVQFAGVPGVFEIDVQDADTDLAAAYNSIPNAILNAVNANNWCRYELAPFKAKFVRLLVKTANANAVNIVSAKVTR